MFDLLLDSHDFARPIVADGSRRQPYFLGGRRNHFNAYIDALIVTVKYQLQQKRLSNVNLDLTVQRVVNNHMVQRGWPELGSRELHGYVHERRRLFSQTKAYIRNPPPAQLFGRQFREGELFGDAREVTAIQPYLMSMMDVFATLQHACGDRSWYQGLQEEVTAFTVLHRQQNVLSIEAVWERIKQERMRREAEAQAARKQPKEEPKQEVRAQEVAPPPAILPMEEAGLEEDLDGFEEVFAVWPGEFDVAEEDLIRIQEGLILEGNNERMVDADINALLGMQPDDQAGLLPLDAAAEHALWHGFHADVDVNNLEHLMMYEPEEGMDEALTDDNGTDDDGSEMSEDDDL